MPSSPAGGLALTGVVHLQDIGDVQLRDGAWAGTKGQSRRLEGFSVTRLGCLADLFAGLEASRDALRVLPSG